ncbi:MAG: exo-alpha-sialidase [Saprospiraceae bacterium]|nr:exo-alpha-sialidase [Saprospiraceae bacterium]
MKFSLLFLLLLTAAQPFAQTIVFESGKEGHQSYRIPALLRLPNGNLLAFAEGRVQHAADFGDVNIVLKTSTDDGKSWSPLRVLVDNGSLQAGNCAPVLDQTDPRFPHGRIFLFYNTGNNHEGEVRKSLGYREVWYITSTDGGNQWSEPVNITAQVHRPNQPQVHAAYRFPDDWRSYANTPGHAIQIKHGKFKGRIYVAANHSAGAPQPKFEEYRAHGFYSDDHGQTFHLSQDVPIKGSNEAMAVELSRNHLMLNIRNQQGDVRARIVALSTDGGATWDTTYFDRNLPDPVCQGSILRIGKKTLAFCNNASTSRRDELTLRFSSDEGRSWPISRLIDKAPAGYTSDYTAYSDLALLSKHRIGVLYERDNYRQIVFKPVD